MKWFFTPPNRPGNVKSKVVRGPGSGKTDGLKDLVLVACDSGASINVTKQW